MHEVAFFVVKRHMIRVSGLKKTYGARLLFEDVALDVAARDRVGLIGANGCGKTTLFRILAGEEQADAGSAVLERGAVLGQIRQLPGGGEGTLYDGALSAFAPLIAMEQELEAVNRRLARSAREDLIRRQHTLQTALEQGGGLTYRSRARSMLLGLGFEEEQLNQRLSTLSGGQVSKVQLARALLLDADFLLLDEPTNHLDIDAIGYLEQMLTAGKCGYIVISHDRYFLDRVTSRTLELKNERLIASNGNYSRHMELQADQQELQRRHYQRHLKEIRRIEAIIQQQKRWNQARNHVTAASKQKQADKLKAQLVAPERELAHIRFRFETRPTVANDILNARGLAKAFGGNRLFSGADLLLKKGERAFLLGPNGCGKTTLLRLIAGQLTPDAGSVEFGAKVKPGYYEQNLRSLNEANTALEEIHAAYPRMDVGQVRNALASFLFRGDDVAKPIAALSGGERARIQLLKLMLSGANLLLLDEPTNHLDIASREVLESALEDYEGTILCVTHDRYLINRLADRVLSLGQSGIAEHLGGYDDFLAAGDQERARQQAAGAPEKPNAYREQRQWQNQLRLQQGKAARLEQEIARREEEIRALMEQLAREDIASDYQKALELSQQVEAHRRDADALYLDWERTQTELEALEQAGPADKSGGR